MSAIPIGAPGWPDLALLTASIARKRTALASSLALAWVDCMMGPYKSIFMAAWGTDLMRMNLMAGTADI